MSESRVEPRVASFSVGFLSGIGGQALYLVLAFPASILLARLLGPEGKGAVDLAILIPTLLAIFVNLGLGSATSYLIGSRRFPAQEVVANLFGVWGFLTLVLTPAYAAVAWLGLLAPVAHGVGLSLLLIGGLLIPLILGRDYLSSIVLGKQDFLVYNSVPVIYATTNLLGIAILVALMAFGRPGAVTAVVAAQLACSIYLVTRLGWSWIGRPRFDGALLREALSYGMRGQAGNILQFFNYRLDVLLLAHFRTLEEVGYYTLAVSLAEFLWYVPNASALVVFPRTASSTEEARQFTPLVFRVTTAITLLAALALTTIGGPFVTHLYGDRFLKSVRPFLLLLPGVVCLGAAKILAADLNGRGVPQYNTLGATLSLLVTVVLDVLLIPRAGATGAAIASSLAYLATLIYTVAAYARISRTPFGTLFRFGRWDVRAVRDAFTRHLRRS